ncbi:hypothetical protein SAMN06295912_15031 [Sphingomonas laterariae]|uniref:Uncharacterized protein n=1 Tax=Edaphosphingomonas laterariae TaxID=861865 RepID=A0A239KCV5_9SPHN|nr:hypothetical protein [Sphingomonas laterariae]SNT16196.1 hypothetical protein SAMN06295912_15031 [Sphingomonas laterariae]
MIIIHGIGDFVALRSAERLLASAGFSLASGCRAQPTGLMFGDWEIAKWRNLSPQERDALHGVMTGDRRNGPLKITLTDCCPAEGMRAFCDAAGDLEGIA